MCGIAGWIDFQRNMKNEVQTVEKMGQTLAHRGPDDFNVWCCHDAAFAHTRLAVIDPEGGKQPMTKMRGGCKFTMVYNGELYNTASLRAELEHLGHLFFGHSDTEVLLASYMEWGTDCLEKLNGIYAFAIYDEKRRRLFLARDRLGVKPLFFRRTSTGILFASELKGLLAHPDVEPVIARQGLCEIVGLGPSRTPGHGVFENIEELRPAHALLCSPEGAQMFRYWDVRSQEHRDSLEQTIERVRELFLDTVERQLISDVPLATFLSGGVDSTSITAAAHEVFQRQGREPLKTFSIDYAENDKYFQKSAFQPNQDAEWIDKVTAQLGTDHQTFVIDQETLVAYLRKAVLARDLPGYADVDASLLWFCERIKEKVTVALSGECADEIFGGYPWFHRPETSAKDGFPWMRATDARQNLLHDEWKQKLDLKDYLMQRFRETMAEAPVLAEENREDTKRRQLFYLNMHWFMATLLDRKDRMSMAASLEVRVPFADHRLVEYVWNIPWEYKIFDGREKGIFRKAMEGIVPKEVLYRKKSPYPKTHHPAYTEAVTKWMQEILADPQAPLFDLFDRKEISKLVETKGSAFQKPWYGQLMTGPQLLAHLAQIHTWLKEYRVRLKDR